MCCAIVLAIGGPHVDDPLANGRLWVKEKAIELLRKHRVALADLLETCCDNESVCDRFGNCCQESVRGFAGRSRFFRYTAMHVAVCVLGAVSDVVRHYGRG